MISGVDLYHEDLISDVNILKANVNFVGLKAYQISEDPRFKARQQDLRVAGITQFAYDFFQPETDGVEQANAFLKCVGPLQSGDMPCALDWEVDDGVLAPEDVVEALKWLQTVEAATGLPPMIYGPVSFLNGLGLGVSLKRYPLWVAEYGVSAPKAVSPWGLGNQTIWQSSETQVVPGIANPCDFNVFNGTEAEFQALLKP